MRNGEWHYWGGDAGSTRYSSLDQIDASNARKLEIAWRWQSLPGEGQPDVNFKATPLMVDGVLYTSAGVHQAAAIDPQSGMTLWVFTPEPRNIAGRGGVPPSGRGVAYWSDGKEKRYSSTRSTAGSSRSMRAPARPIRSSARMATCCSRIELTDRAVPLVGSSSPPLVVGNVVVVQTVPEVAASNKEAVPGHIRGYEVRTGKLLWTFHTIPQRGEPGVRDLGKRFMGVQRQHRRVDDDERRPRARLRLPAHRNSFSRFLWRASSRRQSLRRKHRLSRRQDRQARVALPDRASRRVGLRPASCADPRRHRGERPQDPARHAAHEARACRSCSTA